MKQLFNRIFFMFIISELKPQTKRKRVLKITLLVTLLLIFKFLLRLFFDINLLGLSYAEEINDEKEIEQTIPQTNWIKQAIIITAIIITIGFFVKFGISFNNVNNEIQILHDQVINLTQEIQDQKEIVGDTIDFVKKNMDNMYILDAKHNSLNAEFDNFMQCSNNNFEQYETIHKHFEHKITEHDLLQKAASKVMDECYRNIVHITKNLKIKQ